MKKYFLISAFCFVSVFLFAHGNDSTKTRIKSTVVEYCKEKDFGLSKPLYKPVDTTLDGVQKYFPNNFPYSITMASRKLSYQSPTEIGFNSGFDFLNLFGYQKDEINYYHTRTPYTELNGVFGSKKEQFARIFHTQNITKRWNVAFNMLRIRSTGFYQLQGCTDNNISLSTNYISKNHRYSLLANGIVSSIKANENGGVTKDVNFEGNLFLDKLLIPVNLPDANTKRGGREVYLKQSLNFGKKENIMKGDTVFSHRVIPKHSLSYSINVKDNWFVYSEATPISGYYENTYFDSIKTLDSTHIFTIQNTISWESTLFKNITAKISYDQTHLVQHQIDSAAGIYQGYNMRTNTYVNENSARLEIGKKPAGFYANGLYWNLDGKYIVAGNYQGNYLANATIFAIIRSSKIISFEVAKDVRAVPFMYTYYISNHFRWWNDSMNSIAETSVKLNYVDSKYHFSIGGELNQVTGYVYFDSTFSPKQYNSLLTIYSAFIQKDFYLKHFHFKNKITWQAVGNTFSQPSEEVMHLPEFVTNHSLYYQGKWFSKAADVQLGFDVSFYTSYYADAYMPALGKYYLQSTKKIGNYPYVDFFFNMKIKHACIFFKTEHLNAGLMGPYYLAPHMPAPDRCLKVGVKWLFYD